MPETSLPRVQILPNTVADQIAAGEVVERPASVIKELVENAVDAGATRIRIEVESGGKTLIEVADNGHGMDRENAVLALDRHATSKIVSAADLVGVRTFGFRGEALPAIASVSRFSLVTAAAGGVGTEIRVTGGRIDHVGEASRQCGTTVSVRGLFFNTPARRKFLRSVSSEARAAWDVVATIALAHPDTGFELVLDGRERLNVPPAQSEHDRLHAVWGADIAATLVPVNYAVGSFRVEGHIQRPGEARPTGRRAQLFVNGRPFRDGFLIRAAEAGYRSTIHPGDRPSVLLKITVEPDGVDVNVHPAKLEVRFRDRMGVERVLEEAVRQALGGLESARPIRLNGETAIDPGRPGSETGLRPSVEWERHAQEEQQVSLTDLFGDDAASARSPSPGEPQWGPREFASPIWQLFNTYMVFEHDDDLVFVDQHSAHERVLFEKVMAQLSAENAAAQRLLLPATVELTDEELNVVETYGEAFAQVGFEVEPFGGRSVILQGVPAPHPRFDAIACFRELVADLARGRFGGWNNRLERFGATYACRAAVKAGQPLEEVEMRELLMAVFSTPLPAHDVHGRATIVQLPRNELERRFGRR